MVVKQLSVFLENKEGTVNQIFNILREAGINVASTSLADTADFGILRILVDDTEKAKEVLRKANIAVRETDVLAVSVPHAVGSLSRFLNALAEANVDIRYMYGLSVDVEGASIAIKVNDIEKAQKVIADADAIAITEADLQAK